MRVALAVLTAGLVLAMAGPAHAEVRVVRANVAAPQFAGQALVYDEGVVDIDRADYATYLSRIVLRRPGRRPRVLATPSSSSDSLAESHSGYANWEVSATSLFWGAAFTNYEAAGSESGAHLRGGPLRGRYNRFGDCYGDRDRNEAPSVAVWRNYGAYDKECDDDRPIVVRRLDRPKSPPELVLPDQGDTEIDLAGRYLAIGDERGIRVLDRRDGSEVYAVKAKIWADEGRAAAFELQSDGKLAALVQQPGLYCGVAWFSPEQPREHLVGTSPCYAQLHIRADRVAWIRPAGHRTGELVVKPLAGPRRVLVRFPFRGPPAHGNTLFTASTVGHYFAFDGRRLAYAVARCDGRATLLLRHRLGGPVFRDRDPLGCPLRARSRALLVKRGAKAVGVPVSCPRGCSGSIEITGRSVPQPLAVRAHGGTARLVLDDTTRGRLARRGSSSLRVLITSYGRLGRRSQQRLSLRLRRAG